MKSGYISIIGRPNSGKSTLLNRILGEKLSIVTPKAQTTRHKIVGIHNIPGAQMIFLDTPGIHESEKPLNQYMMEVVCSAVKDADVVCYVIDISEDSGWQIADGKWDVTSALLGQRPKQSSALLIVLNKLDMIMDRSWEEIVTGYKDRCEGQEVIGISAKTGHGVDDLVLRLAEKLPEGEPFYPDDLYTEHPVRFLVAEIIREQVINLMHQEIPYSVVVQVDDYSEKPNIHRIRASIIVEKESQKPMIIGKGGSMIKMIGQLSRAKIEAMVGSKVFLELFVKVEKNWTKNRHAIKNLLHT